MPWKREHGSYYFYGPGTHGRETIVSMTDQVAIGYEIVEGSVELRKHGSVRMIERWTERARKVRQQVGMEAEIAVLVLPKGFPAEEINRCIEAAGALAELVARVESEAQDG